jgi:putative ABC transport system permease protein
MKILQCLKMAMNAILANKMRAFLTMLGIIIGVLSVTVLVAIGQGSTSDITSRISSLGTNLITVRNRTPRVVRLTLDDIETLRGVGGVSQVAPLISSSLTCKAGINTYETTVYGTTEGYDSIRSYTLSSGRFITASDVENRSSVCVVGVEVADELFAQRDVIGETVRIDGRAYTIVGLFTEMGDSEGTSLDSMVFIPFTIAQRTFRNTTISTFYASAASGDDADIDRAVETLEAFMLDKTGSEDYYTVTSQSQLLETMSDVANTMSLLLAGIAGISLLVGGIGIMNIMLVSVSERTREIGIRKAIGAQKLDIMLQFLIEAVSISLMGGLIGLGLGYFVVNIVAPAINVTMVMSSGVALLSLIFSVLVGVIFGSYPANKASSLLPIEALRYE